MSDCVNVVLVLEVSFDVFDSFEGWNVDYFMESRPRRQEGMVIAVAPSL